VPYFKAGLENNEYCVWVTTEPLSKQEAEEAMSQAVPDFSQYLERGQMHFLSHTEWYLAEGAFNWQRTLDAALEALNRIETGSYAGARLTGDMSWLEKRDWSDGIAYDKAIDNVIGQYRVLVLCTYPVSRCGASETIDILLKHRFALIKRNGEWQLAQNPECRETAGVTWESEVDLQRITQSTTDAVVVTNLTGDIIATNEKALQLGGFSSKSDMVGINTLETIAARDRARALQNMQELLEQGTIGTGEFTLVRADGFEYPVEVSAGVLRDSAGQPTGFVTIIKDITEFRHAEEKQQAMVKTALDGFATADLEGRLLDVNDAYCRMLGYAREELLEMYIQDIEVIESAEGVARHLKKITEQGADHFETRHRRKDGRIIDVEINVNYVDIEGGRVFVSVRDITENRRVAEKKQAMARTALDGFWVVNLEGSFLEVNDAYCRMIGYTREELLGMSIQDVEAVETSDEVIRHIQKVTKQGNDHFETRHRCKDGRIIDVEVNTDSLDLEAGRVLVSLRDITERKQVQEALRKAEERFSKALHSSPDAMSITSLRDGRYIEVNDSFTRVMGFSRQEVIGRTTTELGMWVGAEDRSGLVQMLEQQEEVRDLPGKMRHKSGEIRHGRISAALIDLVGEPCIITVCTDTTERQQLQEALRKAEDRFSKIFHSSPESMSVTSFRDGRYIEVNDSFTRVMGFSREEVIGRTSTELGAWMNVEDRSRLVQILEQEGEVRNFPIKLLNKLGKTLEGSISAALIDLVGEPCIISAYADFTERQQMQEELRRFRAISDDAVYSAAVSNLEGRIIYVNGLCASMHGYTPEELIGQHLSILHSEEQMAGVNRVLDKLRREGSYFSEEVGHKRKDNTEFLALMNGVLVKDEQGNPLFLAATGIDITEQRRTEALQQVLNMPARPRSPGRLAVLQARFIDLGLDGMDDRRAIELLLSLALPYQESRKLAKRCIEEFRDLSGFLAASRRELEQCGVPPRCLFTIKLLHELPAQVLRKKIIEQPFYKSSREVFDYLYYSMRDLKKEVFRAIYLDSANQIIDTADLFEGTLESISIRPREIVEDIVKRGTAAVVFVHNHPTGDPEPSQSDRQFTKDLVLLGLIIQIRVLDHIIIGGNRYFSFADEGLIRKYELDFLDFKIRKVSDGEASQSKGSGQDLRPVSDRAKKSRRR